MRELQEHIIEKVRRCEDLEKLQTVNKLLGSAASGRTLRRHITYKGFEEEHTAAEWARRLDLPRSTLWGNLQKGLTIEQIVEMRGLQYPPE